MRAVSIYTATSIRGRWGKNGHVGYALEYYAEGHKQPDVLFDYEPVENVNENRAELIALLRALARMREKCILTLYTESEYLYQGLKDDGHVEKWIKSGWKTVKGTEVKNRDLWQKLMAVLQGNLYTLEIRRGNAYLQGYMQRWRERSEKYEFVRKVWRI